MTYFRKKIVLTPSGGCGCIKGQNICLHCVLCFIIPELFKKSERDFVIALVRLSIMLSPPKPLDEIQNKFRVWVTHMYGACCSTIYFVSIPLGPVEGPKIEIFLNYKVNFKDIYTNFVCVLTNKRYKTYQTSTTEYK